MTKTQTKAAEILKDVNGARLVRLDFYYGEEIGIHEYLAEFNEDAVTLRYINSGAVPERFRLEPETMTRLALAWLQFQGDQEAKAQREVRT